MPTDRMYSVIRLAVRGTLRDCNVAVTRPPASSSWTASTTFVTDRWSASMHAPLGTGNVLELAPYLPRAALTSSGRGRAPSKATLIRSLSSHTPRQTFRQQTSVNCACVVLKVPIGETPTSIVTHAMVLRRSPHILCVEPDTRLRQGGWEGGWH